MNDFEANFNFQQRYDLSIRGCVGQHLTQPADMRLDTEEATDYVLVVAARNHDLRIASRLRRPGYLTFAHEVTVRSQLETGHATEWDKFKAGWCDWMFYGHTSKGTYIIDPYWLLDLHVLRRLHERFGDRIFTVTNHRNGKGECFNVLEPMRLAAQPFAAPELVIGTTYKRWNERSNQAVLAFL